MSEQGIGKRVTRREDLRFITGKGRYTDDINLPGQAYAVFLRSPYPRARIRAIDAAAAAKAPGVVGVFTGKDLAADGIGHLPCGWLVKSKDGSDMKVPPRPPLAIETVNFVGEPYALVVAETLGQARAAAALVETDFEELEPVVALAEATAGPQIHPEIEANRCYDWELGDQAAVEAAFAKAPHVTRLEFANNRLIPNAIEPRAAVAAYNRPTEEFTLYTTSQNPHLERLILAAFVNLAPEHKLRVISPDVGGGFGSKIFVYPEETAAAWAARRTNRPVKWTADRSEAFLSDAHGRDHLTTAELALDEAGTFLALRVRTRANLGAYLSTFASSVPTYLYGTLLAGQYRTPAIHVEVEGVFTNTAPVDAYRGAGRPEATYVVERIVETAARELGIDPAELRRRNFIRPDQFPYETPVALVYDTGDYEASLAKALKQADYAGFPARRRESEARGKRRGIGLSCYIEACGLAPSQLAIQLGAGVGLYESGEVRVNPTGSVTVFTGSHSHGQGHETTFAQIVSEKLGVPFEQVEVVHGDTGRLEFGLGTYGSRSVAVGGSALIKASDKIIAKGKRIAAHMLEAAPDEVDFEDGVFAVRQTNKSLTFGEVAFAAYVPANFPEDLEPGLSEKSFYDPKNFTFPAGSHIAEVEVDPQTGVVDLVRFVAVDDFGEVINPMIVEGQVHGGIAQGVGQALLEHGVYDADGQLVTGSFMDYCLPRADDLPSFEVDTTVTPCTHNPLGVKGCGEAGAIGAPAAVMNAVTDALGVKDLAMPASPERVWRALQAA
ncbi:MAG TPA: xanthine dehydrogenase family protein molybdopterin-binding subunit [Phenylobacterium sp.]|uniref:xanthine dehydrogenase family protein molybdopterin-binding subunit n=1 Tax=Phenylobacterium sp. TaxID=1871053 RepID=UPI002C281AFE|nr:xanthine dehydrogenase family protein molybdopterin-binding subunit [Phenylobacterium sp.]HSV01784.1 xanthine dehydrogenase family protein molybdopterin-binding subunit [Phenylobacterium sp.]